MTCKLISKYIKIFCSCGYKFITKSTINEDIIYTEVCKICHPFYTNTQRLLDTEKRIDKFNKKFNKYLYFN